MRTVFIHSEPVELYKILKFEGLVDSGAAAKAVIADGEVLVNGEVETRKRKQIVNGDLIAFAGEQLQIVLEQGEVEAPTKPVTITPKAPAHRQRPPLAIRSKPGSVKR